MVETMKQVLTRRCGGVCGGGSNPCSSFVVRLGVGGGGRRVLTR